jgi:hypothetical protein
MGEPQRIASLEGDALHEPGRRGNRCEHHELDEATPGFFHFRLVLPLPTRDFLKAHVGLQGVTYWNSPQSLSQ